MAQVGLDDIHTAYFQQPFKIVFAEQPLAGSDWNITCLLYTSDAADEL